MAGLFPRGLRFVLGLGLALSAFTAAAKTTVTRDNTTVTIHVPIEVEGLAGRQVKVAEKGKPDKVVDLGAFWQAEAMRIWNEAFNGVKWGDCLKLQLDLQIIPVKAGERQAGRHRIKFRLNSGDFAMWYPTGPDDQVPTRDFPFAYSRDMVGDWGTIDGETVVHEVGHAMGLGDDYFVMADENEHRATTGRKAEPELGEPDSVMSHSGLFRTPQSSSAFLGRWKRPACFRNAHATCLRFTNGRAT